MGTATEFNRSSRGCDLARRSPERSNEAGRRQERAAAALTATSCQP